MAKDTPALNNEPGSIPVTFLGASFPLIKVFSANTTSHYPLAKKFTSFTESFAPTHQGLKKLETSMRLHASRGRCLYKGPLKRPIIDESRAGLTLTTAPTQLLVIDIDNFPMLQSGPVEYTADSFRNIVERFIHMLPDALHQTSYVAQASSSFGMKPSSISFHLFFFLDAAVPPQMLKWWLTHINLECPQLERALTLTATGHTLSYVVDRCMADNSRIIYIAPPKFDGVLNVPFPNNDDRIISADKIYATARLSSEILSMSPPHIQRRVDAKIKALRQESGLPHTKPGKITMQKVGKDREHQVLTNPDRAVMEYAYHNDTFCYANLNGGDSNAYYWPLENPKWVYNFKDEPLFQMAQVDPDFYAWYITEFRDKMVSDAAIKPLVFRDFATDTYYTVEYDVTTQRLKRFAPAARSSLEDFCKSHWEPLPDPIPTWDVFFDPSGPAGIDEEARVLNLFTPTPYMKQEDNVLATAYKGVGYGEAAKPMEAFAPNLYLLINHALGGGPREFEHFINWLAYAFVRRQKSNIAWIMHGIEGTGKGVFYTEVLQKLFGFQYSTMKRIGDLEDSFDGWREYNLITVVDEFRLADSAKSSRMYDQIKNMISEPFGTVRHMRSNPKEVPLYSNYLFFSNNEDAMRMSANDRRFCLGLRQMVKLDQVCNVSDLIAGIAKELPSFAAFLSHYLIDDRQARVALDNAAKMEMRLASNTWVDDFCSAVNQGNFDFFLEVVSGSTSLTAEDRVLQSKCQEALSSWLLDYVQTGSSTVEVSVEDIRLLYSYVQGKEVRPAEFGKVLSRRGIVPVRMRRNGRLGRYITVNFDFSGLDAIEFIRELGTPQQRTALGDVATH